MRLISPRASELIDQINTLLDNYRNLLTPFGVQDHESLMGKADEWRSQADIFETVAEEAERVWIMIEQLKDELRSETANDNGAAA